MCEVSGPNAQSVFCSIENVKNFFEETRERVVFVFAHFFMHAVGRFGLFVTRIVGVRVSRGIRCSGWISRWWIGRGVIGWGGTNLT